MTSSRKETDQTLKKKVVRQITRIIKNEDTTPFLVTLSLGVNGKGISKKLWQLVFSRVLTALERSGQVGNVRVKKGRGEEG